MAQENGHSSIVALLAREEKPSHLQEVKKPEKKKINIWRRKSFSENEIPELEVTPVNGIHTNWLRIKVCYSEDDNDLELISLVNPDWTIDEWRNKVLKKIPNTDKELFFWHISKAFLFLFFYYNLTPLLF